MNTDFYPTPGERRVFADKGFISFLCLPECQLGPSKMKQRSEMSTYDFGGTNTKMRKIAQKHH